LTKTQRIAHSFLVTWTTVWLLTAVSCRDFEDERTHYKSSVRVEFKPDGKDKEKIKISSITVEGAATPLDISTVGLSYDFPLDPDADSRVFVIHSDAPNSPHTLTITYERVVSLISHQRGAQQEYVLKKVSSSFSKQPKMIHNHLSYNNSESDVQIFF